MRVISFKIDDELLSRLDMLADILGVSRSELIRRAITAYLVRVSWEAEVEREGVAVW